MVTSKQQLKELDDLLNKLEPEIADAFRQSINGIKDEAVLAEIARRISAGNIAAASAFITSFFVSAKMAPFAQQIENSFIAGGRMGQSFALASQVDIRFDITNPGTARILQDYQQRKILQVTREQLDTIDQIVRRGTLQGISPLAIARQIKDGIGLTANQEQAVQNYRTALETRMSNALQRKLRDRRFDATIRRAIRDDKPIPKARIDSMVTRYRERYVKRRSENIARTEAIRAVSMGNNQLWEQAIEEGRVDRDEIRRFWKPTFDDKLRDAHRAIPKMNPNGVGMNEPFKSPLGFIRFPGDPSATPANTINCRCAIFTRIIPREG